jgi:hypothetical protein
VDEQDRGGFSGCGGIDEESFGAASGKIGKRDVVDLYALAVFDSLFLDVEGVKETAATLETGESHQFLLWTFDTENCHH